MKELLRRWLMTLLADEICTLIQAALDDAEIKTFLDGEEIAGIARRETANAFNALTDAMTRQSWGKD